MILKKVLLQVLQNKCFFLFCLIAAVIFTSCFQSPSGAGKEYELKVANWNVQTFFDAETSGNEYKQFVKNDKWNREAYIERLKRLCSVIKILDADVFVMEEIENEAVIHDISNFLAGEWNAKKIYTDSCFATDKGSSIGCAVLSRIPVSSMTVHSLDVRTEVEKMPVTRPVMKVKLNCRDKEIILIVNHWKSKTGKDTGEKLRNMQEGILARLASETLKENNPVLILGDFNRDINDFCHTGNGHVLLRFWHKGRLSEDGINTVCPWFTLEQSLVQPGSYYFKDEWSRIDNMFAAGSADFIDFFPAAEGNWCESDTCIPKRYSLWNGTGYSDHLPIVGIVQF